MSAALSMPAVRERPILFSGPLVLKILAGEKTQTRRLFFSMPGPNAAGATVYGRGYPKGLAAYEGDISANGLPCAPSMTSGCLVDIPCPFGEVGDRLWVRETVRWNEDYKEAVFVADGAPTVIDTWPWQRPILLSIHMPRGVSRITLELTAIRAERLQDITDADAKAEGFPLPNPQKTRQTVTHPDGRVEKSIVDGYHFDARGNFCATWEALNGKRAPWSHNPFVWVLEFRRLKP